MNRFLLDMVPTAGYISPFAENGFFNGTDVCLII